jgi:hypothetical protein
MFDISFHCKNSLVLLTYLFADFPLFCYRLNTSRMLEDRKMGTSKEGNWDIVSVQS